MAKIQAAKKASKFTYSLLPKDEYEARIVQIVLVGMQKRPAFQGKPKPDALLCKLAFEVLDQKITVTNEEDGSTEERPAIVFTDYVVPAAGCSMGKMFDLINSLLGAGETFDDTEDYKQLLNMPVALNVGSYKGKQDGKEIQCVDGIGAIPKKYRDKVEDSTVDNVFFCCYDDSQAAKDTYAGLSSFLQKKIADASDAEHIPAIAQEWPTEKSEDEEQSNEF